MLLGKISQVLIVASLEFRQILIFFHSRNILRITFYQILRYNDPKHIKIERTGNHSEGELPGTITK